jgi:hypothetical protein|tara:strand:+ start:400 stop:552 length:153 start_codon:yes stop_codon:yes gene_type:complete
MELIEDNYCENIKCENFKDKETGIMAITLLLVLVVTEAGLLFLAHVLRKM